MHFCRWCWFWDVFGWAEQCWINFLTCYQLRWLVDCFQRSTNTNISSKEIALYFSLSVYQWWWCLLCLMAGQKFPFYIQKLRKKMFFMKFHFKIEFNKLCRRLRDLKKRSWATILKYSLLLVAEIVPLKINSTIKML